MYFRLPTAIAASLVTCAGAVNMMSTPVPSSLARSLLVEYGENNAARLHGIYGSSEENGFGYLLDRITTDHDQTIVRYSYAPTDRLTVSFTAYNNTQARNWFKSEGMDSDGSESAAEFSRTSWSSIIGAINRDQMSSGVAAGDLLRILHGTTDTASGSIQMRANFSRGYEIKGEWVTEWGDTSHALEVGLRLHEDEEDRLQRNSTYSQTGGQLQLDDPGVWGNAGNRIQLAEALAIFSATESSLAAWKISPMKPASSAGTLMVPDQPGTERFRLA